METLIENIITLSVVGFLVGIPGVIVKYKLSIYNKIKEYKESIKITLSEQLINIIIYLGIYEIENIICPECSGSNQYCGRCNDIRTIPGIVKNI